MKICQFLLPALALVLFSCGGKNQYTFTVTSDQDESDGTRVELYDYFERSDTPLNYALLKDGKAVLKGEVEDPRAVAVVVDGQLGCVAFLERGKIYFDKAADSLYGTPLNDPMNDYSREMNDLQQLIEQTVQGEMADAYESGDTARVSRAMDEMMAMYATSVVGIHTRYYEENKDSRVGAFMLATLVNDPMVAESAFDYVDSVYSVAPAVITEFGPLTGAMERLRTAQLTREGNPLVDVAGVDFATGEATTLSQMIAGRVAVVDFWASWCAPCRAEIKDNLIRIYEKYKDKGVVVIGLDVWDQPEKHREAVQQLGITYPQLVDTTSTQAAATYGVTSIPHIMLVSRDGVILKRGLRGNDIEAAIVKALYD